MNTNFLFTIEDIVSNQTSNTHILQKYARIRRTGTPETSGFYILHEGPIGVLKETLLELDYDDLLDKTETKQSKESKKSSDELVDVCTILEKCSIEEISNYLIKEGKKKKYPNVSVRQ